MRQTLLVAIASLVLGAVTVAPVLAAPELDFIVEAFAREEQIQIRQADLTFRRGESETRYAIQRVLPDRMRMFVSGRGLEQDLYVIGDRMYLKGPAEWIRSPAIPQSTIHLSVAALFEDGLENINEELGIIDGGVAQRVFTGTLSWFDGRNHNKGEIRILIESESRLPRVMTFSGRCGDLPCSFEQAMTYDQTISVEAPGP